MTPEEAEREAERLFVLFQRMDKNPAVSLGTSAGMTKEAGGGGASSEGGKWMNPVKRAVENGEYEKIEARETERELDRLKEEERRDEEEAKREVQALRTRLGRKT